MHRAVSARAVRRPALQASQRARALLKRYARGAMPLVTALCFGMLPSALGGACVPATGGEDAGPALGPPVFDDLSNWTEVRDCRGSHEHELRFIRVVANALALENYDIWDQPYLVGSTLVKLEYFDENCEELVGYTAMEKLEEGENPPGYDWWWQKLDEDRRVTEEGAPFNCIDCHRFHCEPPAGYDLTCAEEL